MTAFLTPGRKIMGRLPMGSDLLTSLEQHCADQDLKLGEVWAIGAVSRARVGYYKQAEQKYLFTDLNQPLEILSLVGNVSLKDGKPMVHAHVTLAAEDGRAFGGHLAPGTTVFACEFVIQEGKSEKVFQRQLDKDTGLFLWPPG
jgi:predicted DNA-binding protein with PD1-like motif